MPPTPSQRPRWFAFAAAAFAASLLFVAPTLARGAVIDFGTTPNTKLPPGSTYVEDGFQLTSVSGSRWAIYAALGHPGSALIAGDTGSIGVGDTISIVRVGGGLFTFDAVDFASFLSGQSDAVNLVGLVGGSQTQLFSNLTSSIQTYQTLAPRFGAAIDELRIVGAAPHSTSLDLDNLVLTPSAIAAVPEPASGALLGVGLLGLCLAARRRARTYRWR